MKDLLLFTLIRLQVVSFELCTMIDCALYNILFCLKICKVCCAYRHSGERFAAISLAVSETSSDVRACVLSSSYRARASSSANKKIISVK